MTLKTGAELFVQSLVEQGVEVIFGIPGAKIDALFNALEDSPIRLILCRHEQNAAFMAQAYGKLTKKPGVVLVTSGPGVSNLVTGLLTATTEGDPVVAIGGNVPRSMKYKKSHQSSNNVVITKAATKLSVEIVDVTTISEICSNAFREAVAPRAGAVFISVPQDILKEKTEHEALKKRPPITLGSAPKKLIEEASNKIKNAKHVALLLGLEASREENTKAIRELLKKNPMAVTSTYQAAGVIPRELEHLFAGRVGLFRNQPGDRLLDKADVIISVGFSTVEYDPEIWNIKGESKTLINIDYLSSEIHEAYNPNIELVGDIAATIAELSLSLNGELSKQQVTLAEPYHDDLVEIIKKGQFENKLPIHPLKFIHDLRQILDDDAMVISDIGSHYMWLSRYFLSYAPRHYLNSNGQQTLGVALPWAMATRLIYPKKKIISVSGDGGFLFSAMELETAVREKLPFVHCVWVDRSYDMVKQQELLKYKREAAVEFGYVDIVKYAEAFGAKGFKVNSPHELKDTFNKALRLDVPCLIEIDIDYSDNPAMFKIATFEGE
jgi:acetolactate synthase I/II/III large subunit